MKKYIDNVKGLHRRSILYRIMAPIMAVMLLQSVFHMLIFWNGNVIFQLETNALQMFSERVKSNKTAISNDLISRSQGVFTAHDTILKSINETLKSQDKTVGDIASDPQLNNLIMDNASGEVISMMRRNFVTEAFFILDGPAVSQNENASMQKYAGIYIRDMDPATNFGDNSDLLLENGMPGVSKNHKIPLDTYWSASVSLNEGDSCDAFFFNPVNAARAYGYGKSSDFAYLSHKTCVNKNLESNGAMTYSMPLINASGEVLGVIGLGFNTRFVDTLLDYSKLSESRNATYFIGVSTDGGKSYNRAFSNGPLFEYNFAKDEDLLIGDEVYDSVYNVKNDSRQHNKIYACIAPLKIYNDNAPFSNEQWALVGLVDHNDIMNFAERIKGLSVIAVAFALLLGVVSAAAAGCRLTEPVTLLVKNLRESNPFEPIHLKKLGIDEIDELTEAIEMLSHSVAQSSEKIAKIFAMTQISVGVFEYDPDGQVVFCSGNLSQILGWSERPNKDYFFIENSIFDERINKIDPKIMLRSKSTAQIMADEAGRWIEFTTSMNDGRVLGAVRDITVEVLTKQRLNYERDYDLLSGLYNRRAFQRRFSMLMRRDDLKTAAVVMFDLDNLKHINDSYGHDCGDSYIKAFSKCLASCDHSNTLVARRSGDEFYAVFFGFESKEKLRQHLDELMRQLKDVTTEAPDGSVWRVHASGGLAWYPDDSVLPDELIRFADFAMYCAKRNLRGNITEFNHEEYLKSAYIINGYEIITTLIEQQLVKYAFQPIISLSDGKVFAYEMLMRPQVDGNYTPYDILKMAQAHSKLYHIERLSMFNAMRTFAAAVESGKIERGVKVFINSIGNQCLNVEDLEKFYREFGDYMSSFALEITESEQPNNEYTLNKSHLCKKVGALLVIDDYGTGYNSESMLMMYSPDMIKIDRSIITNIDIEQNRQNIVESIIYYTKRHNIHVIAEGVETAGELRVIKELGAEYAQGYFIGRPDFTPQTISDEAAAVVAKAEQKQRY